MKISDLHLYIYYQLFKFFYSGIIAAAGKGLFRTMLCDPYKTADLVPVDMVINLMIVSAWRVGTVKPKELKIYNCCTGE